MLTLHFAEDDFRIAIGFAPLATTGLQSESESHVHIVVLRSDEGPKSGQGGYRMLLNAE